MKIRSVALVLGALMLTAAPALAQSVTRTYVATARGTAAQVLVGGQGVQIGHTNVGIRSDAGQELALCTGSEVACAHAATVVGGNDARAAFPGEGEAVGEPNGALPEQMSPLLVAHFGKAVAKAAQGNATGTADASHLELTATQTFADNAAPLVDGLKQVSEALLGPIAEGDPSGQIGPRLKQTVDGILDNLAVNPLVEIDILASAVNVEDKGTEVTATAVAKGAQVVISPTANSSMGSPEGLIIVEVGAASAFASAKNGQAPTSTGEAAVVRLRIFNPVTQTYDVVPVAAGEYQCGGEGTPLETCVGLGAVAINAGVVRAGGVSINALGGNLVLELGSIEAAVGAKLTEAPAPVCPEPPCLPVTGGGLAVQGLALLGLAGGATAMIRRRSIG